MGWSTPDVYYQPERFDLTPVAEIDDWDACYSFDILAVWQHEDGRLFWAQDSGCSCPSPFEDFTSLESLTPLDWESFAAAVDDHCARYEYAFDTEPVGDGWTRCDFGGEIQRKRWQRRKAEPADFTANKVQMLAKVRERL